jgi:hypothetical protein
MGRRLSRGSDGLLAVSQLHTPASQVWLAGHATLQPPQFWLSKDVSVHPRPGQQRNDSPASSLQYAPAWPAPH